jgi:hypothetical protein
MEAFSSNLAKEIPCCVLCDSTSTRPHGASSGCGWRDDPQLWRASANILNKQRRRADKGWFSSLVVGHGANNPPILKNEHVPNRLHEPRTRTDCLDKRPKLKDMDIGFGTRNVRNLHRESSVETVSK